MGMAAFLALKVLSLKPSDSINENEAIMLFLTLSQFCSNNCTLAKVKFLSWNFILSTNSTKQVFNTKSLSIRNPGLPMSYTYSTSFSISLRASIFFQFAEAIDIRRSEKYNGVPPLLVLIKISKTLSGSCSSCK